VADRAHVRAPPRELAGLRWPLFDVDSDEPNLTIAERVLEVEDKYVSQASPTTEQGNRRMALHPLPVAALIRHREEQKMLGPYEDEDFVFPTRSGTPMTMSNLRRAFKTLCKNTASATTGRPGEGRRQRGPCREPDRPRATATRSRRLCPTP
jgi:hypothetical protein